MVQTNIQKLYRCIDGLIRETTAREKKIVKLESRIKYIEGEEYGSELIKRGIEITTLNVLKIIKKYPNNSKIIKEIINLDKRLKGRQKRN